MDNLFKNSQNEIINVLQIGGMDGISFDPLHKYVKNNNNIKLIVLEPIKEQFEKLERNYKDYKNVTCLNYALDYHDKPRRMFTINTNQNILTQHFEGQSSFYNDRNRLGEKYWNENKKPDIYKNIEYSDVKDNLKEEIVNCITISQLCERYNIKNINLLQVDTEGYDYHILNMVLNKLQPESINFEYNLLPPNELMLTEELLKNYSITKGKQDAFCVKKI
tara:strand:- start:85 stop:744 length:660 start_codon:yes stop_codon:yes gene_type:complete